MSTAKNSPSSTLHSPLPRGYKQTEVGLIPEDWETAKLGHIAELYQPITIAANKFTQHGYPVYGANGLVGYFDQYNHETWQTAITCRGSTCGTVNRIPPKSWITGNAMVANCDKTTRLNKDYLYFALKGSDLSDCITGTGQPQIVRSPLFNYLLPLPPTKAEQAEIAEALSDADALIESLEQLIAKKRQIKQGAMQELLTGKKRLPEFSGEWALKRLGDLGATYGGLTGKTKADFGEGTARYITFLNVMSNVVINCTSFDAVVVLPTESQNRVRKGDLLFNGSSETPEEVALCSVLLEEVGEVYLNSFCFGFRFREGANADGLFFAYFLRCSEGRDLMKSLAQGSTRYNLSKRALLDSSVRLPEPDEQTAIADILSDMDEEIATLETKLAKALQVKQGMMQELLTGKTRLYVNDLKN